MRIKEVLKYCDNIPYVMDEAKPYELGLYYARYFEMHRESWEQTRMIAYMTAQVNSKKKLKPGDVMPFPWDAEKKESVEVSAEEKERIIKKMREMERILNNGKK